MVSQSVLSVRSKNDGISIALVGTLPFAANGRGISSDIDARCACQVCEACQLPCYRLLQEPQQGQVSGARRRWHQTTCVCNWSRFDAFHQASLDFASDYDFAVSFEVDLMRKLKARPPIAHSSSNCSSCPCVCVARLRTHTRLSQTLAWQLDAPEVVLLDRSGALKQRFGKLPAVVKKKRRS